MRVLHPLIEAALARDPKGVGDFLMSGKAKDGSNRMDVVVDGKHYTLVSEPSQVEMDRRAMGLG